MNFRSLKISLSVLIFVALAGLVAWGLDVEDAGKTGPAPTETRTPIAALTTKPTQTPKPSPTPCKDLPVNNIRVQTIDIDAPVIVKGVNDDGAMETPEGPDEVAWYNFTARPGCGGNAVLAGHVDRWYEGTPGPAVFWNLKDLEQGDLIEIEMEGGIVYKYLVVRKWVVDGDTSDVGPIIGKTENEVITLITCGGTFDSETRDYDMRTIVRAERI